MIENSLVSLIHAIRRTQTIPHTKSTSFLPFSRVPTWQWQEILQNIGISIIFVSLSGVTIKTPCIVHKNVSVYCVEFQCTKKQTILLLEVWHIPYYSRFLRFILPASFYLSSTSHNEDTTKTEKIASIYKAPYSPKVDLWNHKISCLMYSTPKGFCKCRASEVNFIHCFSWKNSFRHPR